MKKFYITLFAAFLSIGLFAQDVSIGTDIPPTLSLKRYRSPWTTSYNYSYVQTIYLQSEINTSGKITSLQYTFLGTVLDSSRTLEVYMGTVSKDEFDGSLTDWAPVSEMTKVFDGVISPSGLPGPVTINLQTAFDYKNSGNIVIGVFEKGPGSDYDENDDYTFKSTELTTDRVMYYVTDGPEGDDAPIPDPANPGEADNVNGNIANITLHFGNAAPVTLSNFSGVKQNDANKLQWTTQTEQNNKGFDIQKSTDGRQFNSIGFVKSQAANGSNNGVLNYSFLDLKPSAGTNYYRLNQLDFDGKSSLSKIVSVQNNAANLSFQTIYPNPVQSELNLVLTSKLSKSVQIIITNIEGQVMYKGGKSLNSGENKISINTSAFSNGVYNVKATFDGTNESAISRFVKR